MNCNIGSELGYQDNFSFPPENMWCTDTCISFVLRLPNMLVLLVDCQCCKRTARPPCVSSEHHVIPSFAEPPCIASDCELWTVLHLVQTLSIWILMKCSARDLHQKVLPLSVPRKAVQFQSYWGGGVNPTYTCHIDWWIWWQMIQMIAT